MERRRPASLTTIAVLNMVFGALGLICGCINGFSIGVLLTASPDNPNEVIRAMALVAEAIQREAPSFMAIEIGRTLFFLVFSSLLIVAGIGLLYIGNWARIMSFIYAVTAILTQAAYLLYVFMVEYPAVARIQAQFGGDPLQNRASQVAGIFGIALVIAYAIVLIILLSLPGVRAAFSPLPPRDYYDAEEDRYDDYDQDG